MNIQEAMKNKELVSKMQDFKGACINAGYSEVESILVMTEIASAVFADGLEEIEVVDVFEGFDTGINTQNIN